ncbi:MAG: polysaccharide biosynthesis/export family protein [Akkermansiaceae bacterium]
MKLSNYIKLLAVVFAGCFLLSPAYAERIQNGDVVVVSLKGVPQAEQTKVDSKLEVRDDGFIRIPVVNVKIKAAGRQPDDVERSIEQAFVKAEIYTKPTITIQVISKKDARIDVRKVISVGGAVKRNGGVQYREGMTLLQAIQEAGGRTPFASKYVILTRKNAKSQSVRYLYNILNGEHQNLRVKEGDTVTVHQKTGLIDSKPSLR